MDELYNLINSLTKSEKRYIKLAASFQNGNKNYLKLFNEINGCTEKKLPYNDKIVKVKYAEEKFTNQLTFTKNYLTEHIFRNLELYSSNTAIDFKIKNIISKARILYNKALYKQFAKAVEKGKKLCLQYERFPQYLQFTEMEKIVIMKKILPGKEEAIILTEEIDILNKMRNLNEYEQIISRLTGLYMEKGRLRDLSTDTLIKKINESYIMMSEERAISLTALERFFFIKQLMADFGADYTGMRQYIFKRFELIKANPMPFKDRLFNKMQDVIMYILIISPRNNKEEKQRYFQMLKECTGNTDAENINLFLIESALNLLYLYNEKNIEIINSRIDHITYQLDTHKGKTDSNFEILIYSTIVKIYIYAGNYSNAAAYLNKLLNHPFLGIRQDIELYSKILNIIVHYELGNYELLEYLIKSTFRYLLKRKNLYRFEKIIISFFRRLPKMKDNKMLAENLELLRSELVTLNKDKYERNALLFFDFPEWITGKLKEVRPISNAVPV